MNSKKRPRLDRLAKVYVDSNVFFYAKIGDSVYGESCSEVIRQISLGRLDAVISTLIPLEVSNAMRKYGLGHQASSEISAMLSLEMDVIPLEAGDVQEVIEVMSKHNIGPYDCAHAVIMRRNGIVVVISADKGFDKIRWVHRVDPKDAKDSPDLTGDESSPRGKPS